MSCSVWGSRCIHKHKHESHKLPQSAAEAHCAVTALPYVTTGTDSQPGHTLTYVGTKTDVCSSHQEAKVAAAKLAKVHVATLHGDAYTIHNIEEHRVSARFFDYLRGNWEIDVTLVKGPKGADKMKLEYYVVTQITIASQYERDAGNSRELSASVRIPQGRCPKLSAIGTLRVCTLRRD